MGKHSGPSNDEEATTPYGQGPHPTPEESQQKADEFERQYEQSQGKGQR